MIERAIENWLTNTNERTFQLPFCQVLLSQGHKVLYISPHTQMEQGKDIISLGPDGKYHAYQLKTGKLDLGEWRKIKTEVMECVELEIVHPSVPEGSSHISYLVTNGEIKDTVRHQITQINQQNRRKGLGLLKTITGQQLVAEFISAQGKFLPNEVLEFDSFLKLYLADGRDFLPVRQFFELIDRCYFHSVPNTKKDKVHAISSSVILTAYALRAFQQEQNNYAEFQAWAALCGSILRFALRAGLSPRDFSNSLSLAKSELTRSLERLCSEALTRENFLEGDMKGDGGDVYKARATLVLGASAILELLRLRADHRYVLDEKLKRFILSNLNCLQYWGDSALPSFFALLKYLELVDRERFLEMFQGLTNLVIDGSGRGTEGLPNPYFSAQQVLSYSLGSNEDELEWVDFSGESYALETLVLFGAAREQRDFIAAKWRAISNLMYSRFTPADESDWFTCYTDRGTTLTEWPPEQESWQRLKALALDTKSCPKLVVGNTDISFAFLFVVPYRGTSDVYRLLDAEFGLRGLIESEGKERSLTASSIQKQERKKAAGSKTASQKSKKR